MANTQSSGISEKAYESLSRFAEQSAAQPEESETIVEMPSFIQRGAVYLIFGALLVTLALLYFGQVHVVVTAKGKIIPEGDVVSVQAVQGGVVQAILGRVGDRVIAGAPILKLDISESGANLGEVQRKQELQQAQAGVLRSTLAEIEQVLRNPDARADTNADAAGNAAQLISALENARAKRENARRDIERLPEKKRLQTREIELTRENIELNQKNHVEQQTLLAGETQALAQKADQLKNYRGLADRKLLSQLELSGEEEKYRAAENALTADRQRYDQQAIDISNQQLHLSELETKLLTTQIEADDALRQGELGMQQAVGALRQEQQTVKGQIQQAEADINTVAEKIGLAQAKVSLTTITTPLSGTLADVKPKIAGEVVAGGSVVASVVPDGVPLVVEASVENKDIGFVTAGLAARVKVDAYPFEQFGTVAASVSQVLPNAGKDSTFVVRLNLSQNHLEAGHRQLNLFPGLTVEAELLTARQRLLSLLFSKDQKK